MAAVEISNLYKSYADVPVLSDINLSIEDGEFIVLVGPSGCGKSTLLRMISGLEVIQTGEISIDDKLMNEVSPSKRDVAMVFQSYALYPHKTVFENIAFSLKIAGKSKAEIRKQVDEAASLLQISELLDRKPKELSGGQRQRVAIGRAIVRHPKVFLFDEPLSNLDAALRTEMRVEIAKLHKQLGSTVIYVTHDQVEAMTMAQRIAVMNSGKIEQIGAPLELYELPRTLFVAEFIGSPKTNLLPGNVSAIDKNGIKVKLRCGFTVEAGGISPEKMPKIGEAVTVSARPEQILVGKAKNSLTGQVELAEALGSETIIHCRLSDGTAIVQKLLGNKRPVQGETVHMKLQSDLVHVFDEAGEVFPKSAQR